MIPWRYQLFKHRSSSYFLSATVLFPNPIAGRILMCMPITSVTGFHTDVASVSRWKSAILTTTNFTQSTLVLVATTQHLATVREKSKDRNIEPSQMQARSWLQRSAISRKILCKTDRLWLFFIKHRIASFGWKQFNGKLIHQTTWNRNTCTLTLRSGTTDGNSSATCDDREDCPIHRYITSSILCRKC